MHFEGTFLYEEKMILLKFNSLFVQMHNFVEFETESNMESNKKTRSILQNQLKIKLLH